MQEDQKRDGANRDRKAWEPPKLSYLGNVEELVQVSPGGGKVSVTAADPGEPRKTKPSENP